MKSIKITIVLACLFMFSQFYGQNDICTTFETGSFEGWTAQNASMTINSPAMDGTNYLRVRDASFGSWVYNSTTYPQSWVQFIDRCLFFDYKIFKDGHAN